MGKPQNKYSYNLDITVDEYSTSDSTMIDFRSKYCFLLHSVIKSKRIPQRSWRPMVVGKVLQNFQVRYKYFAVTQ